MEIQSERREELASDEYLHARTVSVAVKHIQRTKHECDGARILELSICCALRSEYSVKLAATIRQNTDTVIAPICDDCITIIGQADDVFAATTQHTNTGVPDELASN